MKFSKASKIRIITAIGLVFIVLIASSPFVLAKPRRVYITDFLLDNLIKDEGFANSKREEYRDDNDIVNFEATAYGLNILAKYNLLEEKDLFGKVIKSYNSSDMQDELEGNLEAIMGSSVKSLSNIYFILTALNEMDAGVNSPLEGSISSYIGSLAILSGGFSGASDSQSADIISTYFCMKIYDLLEKDIPTLSNQKAFILSSCNSDGGFGSNSTSSSMIVCTYYALLAMELIDDFDLLLSDDATERYLNSFFVDDENDLDNYGGYLPDSNAKYPLISSTYYCIKALNLLEADFEDDDATAQWISSCQNFQDGGFVDQSDGYDQKFSSVINTYFAYEILVILGKEALLDEEVFMLEFEWYDWIIFSAIFGGITVLLIVGIIIWRKRKF